nr:CBS domain-containing protein [Polyangium spumosum]
MSTPVTTIEPDDNLAFAEELMTVERVRHLPVLDGELVVGLLSHRDILLASESILRRSAVDHDLERKRKARVNEVMRGSVDTIGPDDDAADAADLMLTQKIGCLPVVDEARRLLGIVTDADFVKMARDGLRAGRITQPARQAMARASAPRARPPLAKGTAKAAATAARGAKTIATKKGTATKVVPKIPAKVTPRKGAATRKAPTRRSA